MGQLGRKVRNVKRTSNDLKQREKRRQEVEPPRGEALLALRFMWGLDLWTGEPLKGLDLADWYRLRSNLREVTQRTDDGEYAVEPVGVTLCMMISGGVVACIVHESK